MTNRLKPCLGSIISDKQSAFIEGRLLTDNALIAFEVNHYMKRRTQGKTGLAGMKIDISKAYDRLEWNFMENILLKFGFSEVWVSRIMGYVRSISYSFLHNGVVFGDIVSQRGIRQGDPISPYLYILCVEGLSAIMRRNEEAGLIHGCTIARGAPTISHLLFADDSYFFFKATTAEANVMKNILIRFEVMSGQSINFNKSTVTFTSNTTGEDRQSVCTLLGVQEVKSPGMGEKTLSKGGKVVLLKTSAQVLPNFWMNLFLIPLEICEGIEKKMNAFMWGDVNTGKGIKWLSWDKMCMSKEGGGLSFKKLRSFNITMLAKKGWRLINNENPLETNIMHAKYFPGSDFLSASLSTNPSYMWRSIMEAQDWVKQGCRRRIGDESSTKVWQVLWLPCSSNGFLTTNMPEELSEIVVQNLMMEDRREWDDEILRDICNERDMTLIKQIPIPMRSREDTWFWIFDDKGVFTVHVEDSRHVLFNCDFARQVWSSVGLQNLTTLEPDWKKARESESVKNMAQKTGSRSWVKPPAGWIKINIDASWGLQPGSVGLGNVVRDETGNFLRARCSTTHATTQPRDAEALSLREALSWIKQWRRTKCIFETDSKLLVDALNGVRGRTYFDTIVSDCLELVKHFDDVLFAFTYRSANNVAHMLARVAVRSHFHCRGGEYSVYYNQIKLQELM
ncbi:hypothetical protein AgCh_027952 [Apium graveolens]